MAFDKQYFEDIWSGVHRHDYCQTLADQLIADYQPKSVLDIGTGCGYLVEVLRDRGVEAYGLDVSEYAVNNSHGNVLLGDARNLPFKDQQFDLVHSQGLWEYIPEADIKQAYLECLRVGRQQHHNIDTTNDTAPHTKDFLTHKPQQWWDEKLVPPKILVATPVHISKEYSLQRWLDNVNSFTYPNFDVLVIDNSPTDELVKRWQDKVNIRRIDTDGIEEYKELRKNLSFEQIRQEFLNGDYYKLAIIESDIIPPKDIIEFLIEWGKKVDWMSCSFPNRENQDFPEHGIGCVLFSRKLMEKYDFESMGDNFTADGGLWAKVRIDKSLSTLELWNYIDIVHLRETD